MNENLVTLTFLFFLGFFILDLVIQYVFCIFFLYCEECHFQ